MEFQRKAYDDLLAWKARESHKPLIVEGLRQVGKSYIVDKFAKDNYKTVIVFDFRYNLPLRGCFKEDLTVDGILSSASLYLGNPKFIPGETVLIFEEISDCPEARSSQYEEVIQWLEKAGLILRVFNVSRIETPLECNKEATCYKIFISDIGLLMSNYPMNIVQQLINDTLGSRKGAIYENLVAILLKKTGFPLYYYSNSGKHLEIDYLLETNEGIILLEEKSTNGKMAASRMVMEGKTPYKAFKCVKVIENNFGTGTFFTAIPLYSLQFYLSDLSKKTNDVVFGDISLA